MIKLGGLVSQNPFKPKEEVKKINEDYLPKEAFLDMGAKRYDNSKGILFVKKSLEDSKTNIDYLIKVYAAAIDDDSKNHDGKLVKILSKEIKELAKVDQILKNIKLK